MSNFNERDIEAFAATAPDFSELLGPVAPLAIVHGPPPTPEEWATINKVRWATEKQYQNQVTIFPEQLHLMDEQQHGFTAQLRQQGAPVDDLRALWHWEIALSVLDWLLQQQFDACRVEDLTGHHAMRHVVGAEVLFAFWLRSRFQTLGAPDPKDPASE